MPIHSEQLEQDKDSVHRLLERFDGILVAPGFGERGIEGKIEAVRYVRERGIPFFGICLGMQCAVVEFSRNVAGIAEATSSEVDAFSDFAVIDIMEEQKNLTEKGGTMRLGAYDCELVPGTRSAEAYGTTAISERHRHRYEFNNAYLDPLREAGLVIAGTNPQTKLVEVIELADHPYFVGVQYHPELKSTVENPHPLFVSFVAAAMRRREEAY
jgi:CTP synthase